MRRFNILFSLSFSKHTPQPFELILRILVASVAFSILRSVSKLRVCLIHATAICMLLTHVIPAKDKRKKRKRTPSVSSEEQSEEQVEEQTTHVPDEITSPAGNTPNFSNFVRKKKVRRQRLTSYEKAKIR